MRYWLQIQVSLMIEFMLMRIEIIGSLLLKQKNMDWLMM